MLQTRTHLDDALKLPTGRVDDSSLLQNLDLAVILSIARRQMWPVIILGLIGLLAGGIYCAVATPMYTAEVDLLIDMKELRAGQDQTAGGNMMPDPTLVDNQSEVLLSERISLAVIRNLNLTADPEFNGSDASALSKIINPLKGWLDPTKWFSFGATSGPDMDANFWLQRAAIGVIGKNLDIERVGKSNVLSVSFTSRDPVKAAKIANAFADAYLTDQLSARFEATKRASGWLQARIDELRQQSAAADAAVEKYRSENNLLQSGGLLMSDQQLAQVNTELITAGADTARAKSRYDRLKTIIDNRQTQAAVSEALDSVIINQLRQKYIDVSKRQTEISARLGPDHVQAVSLRNEMAEYERLMFDELGRIAGSYENEYEVAKGREEALRKTLTSLEGVTTSANGAQVRLRQLEQDSATYKGLYQNFLQRYQEALQQESFPLNDARVITDATRPTAPSLPRKGLVIAVSLLLGLGVGGAIGAVRELVERTFRTGEHLRDELGVEYLGMLPAIEPSAGTGPADAGLNSPPALRGRAEMMRYVVDHPFSSFAETLRGAKVTADLALGGDRAKIIGIVSSMPGEGKSTVSKNFASLVAMQGAKALLIDGDLRHTGLTRAVAPDSTGGLVEVILDGRPVTDFLTYEPDTGLAILPAVVHANLFHSSDMLSSPGMAAMLRSLSRTYDYIIVDLPPLAPITDARAAAPLFDAFLFVVEWGKTPRHVVHECVNGNPGIFEKTIGTVLNKVQMNKLKMYQTYALDRQQYELFNQYYR